MRIKSAFLLATIGVGLAAGVAHADLEKGQFGPQIVAKDWLLDASDSARNYENLRGLIVVLLFFKGSMPDLDELLTQANILANLRGLSREGGVVAMGVTDGSRKTVEPAWKKAKAQFPIALECNAHEEYKLESFPRMVILDTDGKVYWTGNLGEGYPAILEIMAEKPPTRTRPREAVVVQTRLDEARAALRTKNYREAYRLARDAFENAVTGDTLKTQCQEIMELIEMIGMDQLAEVDSYIDNKEWAKAVERLRSIIRAFSGLDAGRDARKRLQDLKKDYEEIADVLKGRQSVGDAAALLGKARDDVMGQRFGDAYDKLEKILTDYKDTEVAPIAEGILKRMQQNETVMADVRDFKARKDCEEWLSQARNHIAARRYRDAETLLRRIIDKHPKTKYERTAVEMLKSIPGG